MNSYSKEVRRQVEESLLARGGARLALAPRLVREGLGTGYHGLDSVLRGGLAIAGTSEIVGNRSSGRVTIAAAYLAERTREGQVCAWVDVSGDMTPEAFMGDGGDLNRVLWVRCCGVKVHNAEGDDYGNHKTLNKTPLQVVSYGRDRSVGTPGAKNRLLAEVREVQVSSDRLPKRRGEQVLKKDGVKPVHALASVAMEPLGYVRKVKKPWGRLEQAIKSVDLLVQGGGFGTIVMDMGGIGPEFARKIPLATWFRWRAALERARTSLLVLSQAGCAGSSSEIMLRVEAELPDPGTVMPGISYRLEVVRRRFEEIAGRKKDVRQASAWESRAGWASYG